MFMVISTIPNLQCQFLDDLGENTWPWCLSPVISIHRIKGGRVPRGQKGMDTRESAMVNDLPIVMSM